MTLFEDWKTEYKKQEEYEQKLEQLIKMGICEMKGDGKLHLITHAPTGGPWLKIKGARGRACTMWRRVWFDAFKVVPTPCHSCYKIVIRPKTILQLFQLFNTLKVLGLPSKCGIETRLYTMGLYGGYVYSDSLEEGIEYYKIVRRAVDKMVDPSVDIILKRGCTELELARPGTDKWEQQKTVEEIELERRLDEDFRWDFKPYTQPDWVINKVKRSWIRYARKYGTLYGDYSYIDIVGNTFDGEVLHPVTYQPKNYWDEEKGRVWIAESKGGNKDAKTRTSKTKVCNKCAVCAGQGHSEKAQGNITQPPYFFQSQS